MEIKTIKTRSTLKNFNKEISGIKNNIVIDEYDDELAKTLNEFMEGKIKKLHIKVWSADCDCNLYQRFVKDVSMNKDIYIVTFSDLIVDLDVDIDEAKVQQAKNVASDIAIMMLKKFKNKVDVRYMFDMKRLAKNAIIDLGFINKHPELTPWWIVSSYCGEDILDRYSDEIDWFEATIAMDYSIRKLDKYKDKLVWNNVTQKLTLTNQILDRYNKYIDWTAASENKSLTNVMIHRYSEQLNWDKISKRKKLPEGIIRKYDDKVNWENIYRNNEVYSEQLIEDYYDKFDKEYISYWYNLSEEFMRKHFVDLKRGSHKYYSTLSRKQELSEEFMRDYVDELCISDLIENQEMSDEFKEWLMKKGNITESNSEPVKVLIEKCDTDQRVMMNKHATKHVVNIDLPKYNGTFASEND